MHTITKQGQPTMAARRKRSSTPNRPSHGLFPCLMQQKPATARPLCNNKFHSSSYTGGFHLHKPKLKKELSLTVIWHITGIITGIILASSCTRILVAVPAFPFIMRFFVSPRAANTTFHKMPQLGPGKCFLTRACMECRVYFW